MDLLGQQFGNYRLVQRIGQGGFAQVYLGEHVQLGMKAAIKILRTHLLTEQQINGFQYEAKIVAELAHPHIVRVLDFDLQDDCPFLVLDYAPGGTLRQKHPRGSRVPLSQIISYVQQIASALEYAHERKLIHRDVKPENLLVGRQGEILLSDFGIVTLAHATSSMSTEAVSGTLAYMAPEQIQGKPRLQSDQYALAVVVYHWLTGTLPFEGSSAEMVAQHLGATPPSLRTMLPDLPAEVEQVVLTALAKNPVQRFGTVQAFANALTAASEQTPASLSTVVAQAQALEPAASDIPTTPQASPAAVEPDAPPPRTLPTRPALKSRAPTAITPPLQPQWTRIISSLTRRWHVIAFCSLVITVLLTGLVAHFLKGDGSRYFPYRLSASDTSVQNVEITPEASSLPSSYSLSTPTATTSNPSAPIVTVTALQLTTDQTIIYLSVQGAKLYGTTSTLTLWKTSQGSVSSFEPIPSGDTLSPGSESQLTFTARPQAGDEWTLDMHFYGQNSREIYVYKAIYLQFE